MLYWVSRKGYKFLNMGCLIFLVKGKKANGFRPSLSLFNSLSGL